MDPRRRSVTTPVAEPTVTVTRHEVVRDGLRLGTVTVHPANATSDSPLVVTLGIMAHLEGMEVQRFRMLADQLQRPVIALDTPGWTRRGGALPSQIRARLRSGGFDWLGGLLGDVLLEINPEVLAAPLSVLGYSLGASTGSALAADLHHRGATLRGLTLVEPVAVREQSLVELAWRNLNDARHSRRYSVESSDVAWAAGPVGTRPVPRGLDLGLLVWAISRGQIPQTLHALPVEVPLMIISGDRSTLSPLFAMRRLVTTLRRQGRPVDHHVVHGAHHALWNSLPHVARIADLII